MKKLLLSLLMLIGSYSVTKPMEYVNEYAVSAALGAVPMAMYGAYYVACGPGNAKDRARAASIGVACSMCTTVYAELISPASVCWDLFPNTCTTTALQLSRIVFPAVMSLMNVAAFDWRIVQDQS